MTPAQFRIDFPEFTSLQRFPDATVTFWMGVASKMLPVAVWGDTLDYGIELFTAHNISLSATNQQISGVGGIPGNANGLQSSKAVADVSASYDTSKITLENGGFWNLTTYGIQFLQLARMFGAGGYQL